MTYTLPAWADSPSATTPLSAANFTLANTAINSLDSRTTTVESGKLDKSTLVSKGDLYVATAAGVVVRIGAGTDGQVFTADSTQTPGVRWATTGGVASVSAADSTITIAGTAGAPTFKLGTVAESAITGLTTDLAAKAPLASPTFTGTVTAAALTVTGAVNLTSAWATMPDVLTDATTIVVNASLGNQFRVTLAGSRTMGAPSSPTDGQKLLFEIIQDATGSRIITWTAGAGGYAFGSDIPVPTLTTTGNKRDFVGFTYNSTTNFWYCLAVARGF